MPVTRKKIVKTVYKDENESEDSLSGDFSDSGSEVNLSEASSAESSPIASAVSSDEDFAKHRSDSKQKKSKKVLPKKKKIFSKEFLEKLQNQSQSSDDEEKAKEFTIKDLTESDKLLPAVLKLSESESSDCEYSDQNKTSTSHQVSLKNSLQLEEREEASTSQEYIDVFSGNLSNNSMDVAQQSFDQFQQHSENLAKTKAHLDQYSRKKKKENKAKIKVADLLALGEDFKEENILEHNEIAASSSSENEDWEEVKEAKVIPKSGIQLVVDFPGAEKKKTKALDVEMMMRRKINRVKKEYQIYMHKVHVLCWIAHGNYVNKILNDEEVMAAALSLLPSQQCYPSNRIDLKYIGDITKWYRNKLTIKQDKYENKFKPNDPALNELLKEQIRNKVVTSKKFLVFIFVSMLRALGINCRLLLNFVTLPMKPPQSELCSLSTKKATKEESVLKVVAKEKKLKCKNSSKSKKTNDISKNKEVKTISQLDGNDDNEMKEHIKTPKSISKRLKQNTRSDDENQSTPKMLRLLGKENKLRKSLSNHFGKLSNIVRKSPKKEKSQAIPSPYISMAVKNSPCSSQHKIKKCLLRNSPKGSCVYTPTVSHKKTPQKMSSLDSTASIPKITLQTPRGRMSIPQLDGNDDTGIKPRKRRTKATTSTEAVSPPKKMKQANDESVLEKPASTKLVKDISLRRSTRHSPSPNLKESTSTMVAKKPSRLSLKSKPAEQKTAAIKTSPARKSTPNKIIDKSPSVHKSVENKTGKKVQSSFFDKTDNNINAKIPVIKIDKVSDNASLGKKGRLSLNRPETSSPIQKEKSKPEKKSSTPKSEIISKHFASEEKYNKKEKRVSHRDLIAKAEASNSLKKNVRKDLMKEGTEHMKETYERKTEMKKKSKKDEDEEYKADVNEDSDIEFKPSKLSPNISKRKSTAGKSIKDRRVVSSDEDGNANKKNGVDVWCEVYIEELQEWISVDVCKAQVHCVNEIYKRASHPVAYVIGWNNSNYLKDLTRRYVPHWNTVTRKMRVEPSWLETALKPYIGPRDARDIEENQQLDRLQLDAPLPKIISEYKNHPLYALRRHLLKFEALYPPDAPPLGYVREEPVYARECVFTCRSRDTWLKEAKVVKPGEKPYKVVKARPKWDRLSNKAITDIPLEIFGPWQIQDYEPPAAENGLVPRNAYGNVELFKKCMLPKGTVHLTLPGLNKVAKKLNIDCAPAMVGFDFHGGWTHPVFDGFVVCEEFEKTLTDAWIQDQEEQERKEREKIENRVYGNWKKLIKGLLIRERLREKYSFEEPKVKAPKTKSKGPRFATKKK